MGYKKILTPERLAWKVGKKNTKESKPSIEDSPPCNNSIKNIDNFRSLPDNIEKIPENTFKKETIKHKVKISLDGSFLTVNGKFEICGDFYVNSEIKLEGAEIKGNLVLKKDENSKTNPFSSMNMICIKVHGNLIIDNIHFNGKIDISNSDIFGDVKFTRLKINTGEIDSFILNNSNFYNNLIFEDDNKFYGTLSMNNIHIKNNFVMKDTIINPEIDILEYYLEKLIMHELTLGNYAIKAKKNNFISKCNNYMDDKKKLKKIQTFLKLTLYMD